MTADINSIDPDVEVRVRLMHSASKEKEEFFRLIMATLECAREAQKANS